ncbi:MAG: hypothetical protein IPK13_10625 [Deltaproteobacteria bacterium]|nr:hypothetical protein [Deltaproteobacteria bacterium]
MGYHMRIGCSEILTILTLTSASTLGFLNPSPAWSAPSSALEKLRKRLPAKVVPVENPCLPTKSAVAEPTCKRALDRTLTKLKAMAAGGGGRVRVLHLGDSHIASDYITSEIRRALQARYGDAGRGFVQIDQLAGYGGRRKKRSDRDWELDRIVDTNRAGRPFGFSGISIESRRAGAVATYALTPEDQVVRVYYQAQPGGAVVKVSARGRLLGEIVTDAPTPESRVAEFSLTEDSDNGRRKRAGRRGALLEIVAKGPKARLYGLSFERRGPGVLWDAIGPVGADAKVYLDLDRASFVEHLKAHRPDLIVLMVGGNDALKIRKSWTDLDRVRQDHEALIDVLKSTLPESECLIWSPMDAGERKGKKVVSKEKLSEVRTLQREVAIAKGCGFWDFYASMGGENSIAAWAAAGVMNRDLVHPKAKAADLLGALFVEGFGPLLP